ncbi:MAG: rod shape-determining protein MreC [Dehalococcoidia bacterium]
MRLPDLRAESMLLTRPLTWFLSILLLGLALIVLSQSAGSVQFRDATQLAASPLESSLHAVFAPMADFVTNAGSYGDMRSQNQRLQTENERLKVEVAQLQEQATQSSHLGDLLKVQQQQPGQLFLAAHVVARDPSNLHDQIEINRGSNDGLRTGMVVEGIGGAMVGTVRRLLPDRAWVSLISDSSSNVNVLIQESRAEVIVRGAINRRLTLQFVAESTDVKVGDTVLTSGLGGGYPAGVLIGHVSGVQGQPVDLFKKVTVEPAIRLDSLEQVIVNTSFVPSKVGG